MPPAGVKLDICLMDLALAGVDLGTYGEGGQDPQYKCQEPRPQAPKSIPAGARATRQTLRSTPRGHQDPPVPEQDPALPELSGFNGSGFLPGGPCSSWIRSGCFRGLDLDCCLVDLALAGGWILTFVWWILLWAGIVVLSGVDLDFCLVDLPLAGVDIGADGRWILNCI